MYNIVLSLQMKSATMWQFQNEYLALKYWKIFILDATEVLLRESKRCLLF